MHRIFRFLPLIAFSFALAWAQPAAQSQLTRDQKLHDFQNLAALYSKHYGPYEWKKLAYGFDLLDLRPWLDRVERTTNDIEFWDVCVEYVASLNDSHNSFSTPSGFVAFLPLETDLYDGDKVLIDLIDRTALPRARFPFNAGDEVVSVDGIPALELVKAYEKYSVNGLGNPVTRRRYAAQTIATRRQRFFPRAFEVKDNAVLEIREADGQVRKYDIPWTKFSYAVTGAGVVPTPRSVEKEPALGIQEQRRREEDGSRPNAWGVGTEPAEELAPLPMVHPAQQLLIDMQTSAAQPADYGAGVLDALFPAFNPPAGFAIRLGVRTTDPFLTGTYPSNGKRVGLIRIPTMSPAIGPTAAVNALRTELVFMEANTDVLVIDVMRNGGGNLCYVDAIMRLLATKPFRSVAYNIRATNFWVQLFATNSSFARLTGQPSWIGDLYDAYADNVREALKDNRAMTGDMPICGPQFENQPVATAYTKPILVLTDDMTLSAGEALAGYLQDEGRAKVFGVRTAGGGGNPAPYDATAYSESSTRVTRSLVTRGRVVTSPGLPPGRYFENIGVVPDIEGNLMTKANLTAGGQPFVAAFTAEAVKLTQ